MFIASPNFEDGKQIWLMQTVRVLVDVEPDNWDSTVFIYVAICIYLLYLLHLCCISLNYCSQTL